MGNSIGILFTEKCGDRVAVGLPITMQVQNEESLCMAQEPTVSISQHTAQQLMDELWYCGLRPTEGTGSAGAMAATQAHLEDMRRLVFENAGKKATA